VNPRGIAQAPNGWLYVAESGNADGNDCDPPKPPFPGPGPLTEPCLGLTGAITRIDPTGVMPVERIVTGLPSVTERAQADASGPYDISFLGTGHAIVTLGLGGDVEEREDLGADGALLGHLLKVSAAGRWKAVGDVAAHEESDPDGAGADSNGFGVLALPSRNVVVDAGGNTLVEVRANGATHTLAVFAPVAAGIQAVPTSVALGPDGYFYVGQLTGFPFPAGAAKVWRVPPDGGTPEVCATGFTTIVDVTFDPWGNLYVLEFASGLGFPPNTGRLSKLDSCRARQDSDRIDVMLSRPSGVVIGLDGAAYVTNNTFAPAGTGEVLRIPLN
jgi:glucose/arabinose dehydrogenase